jgi:SecD/SecF fusion protein
MLDDQIISAPTAAQKIDSSTAEITGSFTKDRASKLAALIRGGALPVALTEVESSQIGASIGLGALENSVVAGAIGIAIILIVMIVFYRLFGLAADFALILYVPLLLWALVLMGAVMTLPGIAGIILSIGMAIDANVIVISRVREEAEAGKSGKLAAHDGYRKALSSIIDSQVTTIITAVILIIFGTGAVRGFAYNLIVGIIIGLITALFVAQLYSTVFVDVKALQKPWLLGITTGKEPEGQKKRFHFKFNYMKHRKWFYTATLGILVIGLVTGLVHGHMRGNFYGNLGIDFTGGTRLQVVMDSEIPTNQIEDTLKENGVEGAEIVHYTPQDGELNTGVTIKTTQALDNDSRSQIIGSFEQEYGVDQNNISFEQFGPSIGKMLTNNAVKSILLSALFMLIYIVVRFKWRYGVASLASVFHDAFMMIAMYGLFDMTINNPFIAALLTVIGYSINDTIVIFDRVRENLGLMHRSQLGEVVDTSINQMLGRSLMTSVLTLISIVPLVIMGGDSIREFAMPLLIGIICGAVSSVSIANPVFYDLNRIGSAGLLNKKRTNFHRSQKQGGGGNGGPGGGGIPHAAGHGKKSKAQRKDEHRRPGDGAVV